MNSQRTAVGNLLVVDRDDAVDEPRTCAKFEIAGPHGHQAVGDAVRPLERDARRRRRSTFFIEAAPDGSTPMTVTVRLRQLDRGRDAGDQPAAADRAPAPCRRRALVEDLEADAFPGRR